MGQWPPNPKSGDVEAPSGGYSGGYYASRPSPPPQPMFVPTHENWFPWFMPMIFVLDIALFIYTMYVNDCPSKPEAQCLLPEVLGRFAFEPFKANPLLGPDLETLRAMGGLVVKSVVDYGEGWRLITCIWLHGGVVHLLANMMSLIFIGVRLEQEFGFLRIGLLFIVSGFGGSLCSCFNLGAVVSVGASGALFGLLGAMLSELITNWTIYANKCAALLTLLLVIALNLAVGLIPGVDTSAHIGGFISGFFLGFILLMRPQFGWVSPRHIPPGYNLKIMKPKHKCYQYLLLVTALVTLITGYTVGLARLYKLKIPD